MITSNPGVVIYRRGTRKKSTIVVERNGRLIHARKMPLAKMQKFLKFFRMIAASHNNEALSCTQPKLLTF